MFRRLLDEDLLKVFPVVGFNRNSGPGETKKLTIFAKIRSQQFAGPSEIWGNGIIAAKKKVFFLGVDEAPWSFIDGEKVLPSLGRYRLWVTEVWRKRGSIGSSVGMCSLFSLLASQVRVSMFSRWYPFATKVVLCLLVCFVCFLFRCCFYSLYPWSSLRILSPWVLGVDSCQPHNSLGIIGPKGDSSKKTLLASLVIFRTPRSLT